MSEVGIASVLLGCLIIALRGGLLVAPSATAELYLRAVETLMRVRVMGALFAVLGVGCVRASEAGAGVMATVIGLVGWLLVFGGAFLVIFPAPYRRLAQVLMEALDVLALRAIGALGVVIGVLFVYFGLAAA